MTVLVEVRNSRPLLFNKIYIFSCDSQILEADRDHIFIIDIIDHTASSFTTARIDKLNETNSYTGRFLKLDCSNVRDVDTFATSTHEVEDI